MNVLDRRLCIAPMMDWTDRHCRYLFRLLFPKALLYTEMVTTGALIHGNTKELLEYNLAEHPVVLQLGGSDPHEMATCARIAEDYSFDEVNINVGCPSDRVQSGAFGACLMAKPDVVAECVERMAAGINLPVTVKTRIGIDQTDQYEQLYDFIRLVAEAGCEIFIIHARKAWLNGLSPKENRHIPPLKYDVVYQLKQDFPGLEIIINGGIQTVDDVTTHLQFVDGVMIGREAYHNPYGVVDIHKHIFGEEFSPGCRRDIVLDYIPYIREQLSQGVFLKHMTRHMLGLFLGVPGAKHWRRYLSECAPLKDADISVVETALQKVMHYHESN